MISATEARNLSTDVITKEVTCIEEDIKNCAKNGDSSLSYYLYEILDKSKEIEDILTTAGYSVSMYRQGADYRSDAFVCFTISW